MRVTLNGAASSAISTRASTAPRVSPTVAFALKFGLNEATRARASRLPHPAITPPWLPRLRHLEVRDKDDGLLTPALSYREKPSDSDRLSDLPRLLGEEAVIDVVRNLYDVVVTRHPLGIPRGNDKVTLSPLLSKHLRGRFDAAQACQDDYFRQNPPRTEPKPAWLSAGLFSGDGVLATPTADLVDHKERQDDGSFLVLVWLSREDAAQRNSNPPAPRWRNWHVIAHVKSEDGRFVIDDVQLFSDDATDGSSRHLSDLFAGCDGPRWVGMGDAIR